MLNQNGWKYFVDKNVSLTLVNGTQYNYYVKDADNMGVHFVTQTKTEIFYPWQAILSLEVTANTTKVSGAA